MTLKKFIANQDLKPTAWAEQHGFPGPVITRFLKGTRGLSLETAVKIFRITEGTVPLSHLCPALAHVCQNCLDKNNNVQIRDDNPEIIHQ
jgi:hypothetical protein